MPKITEMPCFVRGLLAHHRFPPCLGHPKTCPQKRESKFTPPFFWSIFVIKLGKNAIWGKNMDHRMGGVYIYMYIYIYIGGGNCLFSDRQISVFSVDLRAFWINFLFSSFFNFLSAFFC